MALAVQRRYRETLAASEVKDTAQLDQRHSTLVTISYHPDLSEVPLVAGGMTWNTPVEGCSRVVLSVSQQCGSGKKAPVVAAHVRVRPKPSAAGEKRRRDDELPDRTGLSVDELLAFLDA